MQQIEKQKTFKQLEQEGKQLEQEGKLNQAIEKYQQALQINVPVLNKLVKIYESRKEFDQALTYLQRIIQLRPDNGLQ